MLIFADEAFAAKHMPDLGHDVKEFKVFTWPLKGWKKLEKKLTGPEFECGGHKWRVARRCLPLLTVAYRAVRPLLPGAYYSSPSATQMHHRTTPFLYISTTLIPSGHQKAGMLVHSSRS